jgi:hypothetical protein
MNCELFHESLSAWLDRELSDASLLAMQEHAAACTSCRAAMEASQSFHELLSQELTPTPLDLDRFCQRVVRELPKQEILLPTNRGVLQSPSSAEASSNATMSPAIPLAYMSVAALVGFVAAWWMASLYFRPVVPSAVAKSESYEFGKVVELIPSPSIRYPDNGIARNTVVVSTSLHQHTPPSGSDVSVLVGCTVQSPQNYPCELTTHRGATVRMDQQTEVKIESEDALQLKAGRLWYVSSDQATAEPLVIHTPLARLQLADAECHVDLGEHGLIVDGLRGIAQVTLVNADQVKRQPVDVEAGERLHVDPMQQVSKGTIDPLLLPSWMDKVAVLPGSNPDDLRRRVASLWEQLQLEPKSEVYAVELRKIGMGCSQELSAFVCPKESSPRQTAPNEQPRRELASMILADVVDFDSAETLVPLLLDDNHVVRYHAARGLARVAGHGSTMSPADWQAMTSDQCQAAADAWRRWLADPHHEVAPQLRFLKKKA